MQKILPEVRRVNCQSKKGNNIVPKSMKNNASHVKKVFVALILG